MASSDVRKERQESFRRPKYVLLKPLCKCLMNLWVFIHSVIDCIIDLCFSFYYNDSKRTQIPTVKESLLMESAVSLAERIRNKEVSAEVVVQGFINRICEVNPLINSVVDERYEVALQEARDADTFLASTTLTVDELKLQKPFLGVPFSTKDSTAVKGMHHTLGLVSRRNVKATEDADVVILLKKAGGILVAVTNIPEYNLWCESRNNVYGQTLNPYNTTRTVGGSSGGEASIIAVSGSPMGIGTDIGGSIRMPAFYCGIFGHKPTTGLTPLKGLTKRTGLEETTMVTAGPLCRYAQDLLPLLKVLVGNNISQLQLEAEVSLNDIQFFYMEESGDLRSSSVSEEMRQALQRAVSHFQDLSKTPVQKVKFSGMRYSFKLWRYWMTREPFDFSKELADGKGTVSVWKELPKKLLGQSDFTFAAIMNLINRDILPQENPVWAESTTEHLLSEILGKLGDNGVLLYPSHPFPAVYHYSSLLRPFNFGYWAVFNVLKLPVTQVPMGLCKDGLPLGIQVVAAPYKDHLCIAVAKELQKAFGGWVPPFPV
ncbi:fatty-acid amide hydrolase 2-like isoform X2 [Zootermopsis nevadensis]|uniref:Fatty-acid amide hydrolase 2 n=1 Tax=Zootermopsis nevadensis TaxID=136037 RepID=A0A067RTD2_ZOONE|nr:fatty-acid amide hydrolase 2-like isoform X2 [Zootermopsis nevadensis]KDR24070.1 Fatty-acid amide hydrolase 2 [Zootermopsis nevadensis]